MFTVAFVQQIQLGMPQMEPAIIQVAVISGANQTASQEMTQLNAMEDVVLMQSKKDL